MSWIREAANQLQALSWRLSTALLVLGGEGLPSLSVARPDLRALVTIESGGRLRLESRGIQIGRYLPKAV
jgi:hypothetical protein